MSFLADLRIALRTLLRSPGFFGMATGVLSLGVVVVVTMFGFLRVTLAPPPLDRVDRVVSLQVVDARHGEPEKAVRLQDVEDWRREQRSFEGVAGVMPEPVSFRPEGGAAERVPAARVKGPFLDLLRVHPLLGRNLVADDTRPGASPAVVLSERLWRSTFGADPSVIGKSVRVYGEAHTIVGVAPEALDLPPSALLWFADRTDSAYDSFYTRSDVGRLPRLLAPTFLPVGRLRDGVSPEQASAELQGIQARRAARYPEVATERPDARPLSILWMGGEYQRLFQVLSGSVVLVLALACVNAAGLLLVRGAARTHEAAVRLALGAGRFRLASQLLAESTVIGAAAALVAATLAAAGMEVLRRIIPAVLPTAPSWWQVRLHGLDLLAAMGIGMAAALGAGLFPAVRVSRVSVGPLLRDGQRDTGLRTSRLVRWLVVVEIALSAALLTTAGLVIRSGSQLGTGDVGVPTEGFLTAQVQYPPYRSHDQQRAFVRGLLARLRAIPGVEAATVTTSPPGVAARWRPMYRLPDRGGDRLQELPSAPMVQVTPGFFETFRIPVVQGRAFRDSDDEFGAVAAVSEALARAAWPGESPIGKVMRIAPEESWIPPVRIVGVVRDVRYDQQLRSLGRTPPAIYVPLTQWPSPFHPPFFTVALRNPGDPKGAAEAIRRAVREVEPDATVSSVGTLNGARQREVAKLILVGRLFAAFGAGALILAASGVYAVVSTSVAQRTRELAIRRALGAPRSRMVAAVVARTGWQLLLGLALGMVLAPAMGALMETVIVQPDSALLVYLGVAGVLSAALLAALLFPLLRALSLEPSAVLRHT